MARQEAESVVTLSVLDRLIDEEPKTPTDRYPTRAESVRRLKTAVRRDLEWLLNTRQRPDPAPESVPETYRSLYNYGLADFTTLTLSAAKDRQRLLRSIETTIANYEPRLAAVKVVPVEVDSKGARVLRFQIEGLLLMDPAPEQVSFDTVLQLTSGEYRVKGEQHA